MNIPNLIASSIRHSVIEVFSTMLNVDLNPGEIVEGPSQPEPNEAVISFIGLAGTWAGTGTIMCPPAVACRICSQMLMTEAKSVDEEVLDAVAELTNMVIGSVKNDLERHLGQLGISIPTVIFGRNFKTRDVANAEWVVQRFRWDGEDFLVKLCVAPSERQAVGSQHTIGLTCPIDVKV